MPKTASKRAQARREAKVNRAHQVPQPVAEEKPQYSRPRNRNGFIGFIEVYPWFSGIFVLLVIGLPVLYVASFGPACWLCEHGVLRQKLAWIAYRPLTWMASSGPRRAGIKGRIWFHAEVWIRAYATAFGDKRRIESKVERDGLVSAWPERAVCQAGSMSPIDYEIEQSQTIDVIGEIVEILDLRRQSRDAAHGVK